MSRRRVGTASAVAREVRAYREPAPAAAPSGPPSERKDLSGWRAKRERDWGPSDLLGFYAAEHLAVFSAEDPVLRSEEGRRRGRFSLAALLRMVEDGESVREFVTWAVDECRRSRERRWPKDGSCSPGTLAHDGILLKRWRARTKGRDAAPRGRDWEDA
jgi:hypothetical protein